MCKFVNWSIDYTSAFILLTSHTWIIYCLLMHQNFLSRRLIPTEDFLSNAQSFSPFDEFLVPSLILVAHS